MGEPCVVRSLRAAIVLGLVAAGLIGANAAPASAAKCESWGGQPPNVGSSDNQLQDVAATSACNALAVGYYYNGTAYQTLILHWSGNAWRVQQSEDPGGSSEDNELSGVAATSSTNAWAVGDYYNGTTNRTLIEHWNGKKWSVQKSPSPGKSMNDSELSGVVATSPTNAWAVGYYNNGNAVQTLVEHWNGKKWSVQPSPSPSSACAVPRPLTAVPHPLTALPHPLTAVPHPLTAVPRALAIRGRAVGLSSVAATSSSNAWAVGIRCGRSGTRTLVEHWNGKTWKIQRSQNPGGSGKSDGLSGVAATPSGNAWAVGAYTKNRGALRQTLIERFNGKAWKVQPSPNADPSQADNGLFDVAATSSGNAWAVGSYGVAVALDPPVVERWNGKAWKIQPSSSFPDGVLYGVAAISSSDAWAVGSYYNGTNNQSLILHCC
jgi:hypothetical protein